MENNILIAGVGTVRGIKLAKFLTRKGHNVYGVDRHQPMDQIVKKFFRMDMRHQDNMELIMTIVKPTTLVFCPESVSPTYNSYISFSGVLGAAMKAGVKRVALCLDDIFENPKDVDQVAQLAMSELLGVYVFKNVIESLIITKKSNLLKEMKEFCKTEGGELKNDIS